MEDESNKIKRIVVLSLTLALSVSIFEREGERDGFFGEEKDIIIGPTYVCRRNWDNTNNKYKYYGF